MIGRIIEIAEESRHLSLFRGFMVVSTRDSEVARVPLDDIAAVIATGHGLTCTKNLLVELAKRNSPFVLCANNFSPVGVLWSVEGYYQQGSRMDAQIACTKPKAKRLWQQIVRQKIAQQAAVLEALGRAATPVSALIPKVRSGDPDNIEAQAARRYWPLVFGENFRRDRKADGVNALLNYGYMVLRASMARAVMAAGLHPTLGIHHRNRQNPLRLVDDLMEPFRPLVDFLVVRLLETGIEDVQPEAKLYLAKMMYADLSTSSGVTPVITCLQRFAVSLGQVYEGAAEDLDLPAPAVGLELAALCPFNEISEVVKRVPPDVDDGAIRSPRRRGRRAKGGDRLP